MVISAYITVGVMCINYIKVLYIYRDLLALTRVYVGTFERNNCPITPKTHKRQITIQAKSSAAYLIL